MMGNACADSCTETTPAPCLLITALKTLNFTKENKKKLNKVK